MSNTFTAQELADFYQKVADGGEIDYTLMPKDCFGHPENGPHMGCSKDMWRIKPTKKVIDLSVLIESGIDCEFKDSGDKNWHINKVAEGLYQESLYGTKSGDFFEQCKPRINHIHAWRGGECPLPEGFEVLVVRRDESQSGVMNVESVNWNHVDRRPRHICEGMSVSNSGGADIIAFEVLGLADGYVMPWEQDND